MQLSQTMEPCTMIAALHTYSHHSLFGLLAEGTPALFSTASALANKIAQGILIQVALSATLFYLHHNIFSLGFVVGFVFDKQVREVVEKVDTVYNAKRTLLEQVVFFGGGGLLAILTMPTSLVAASLYYSAQWGALLYHSHAPHRGQANKTPEPDEQERI